MAATPACKISGTTETYTVATATAGAKCDDGSDDYYFDSLDYSYDFSSWSAGADEEWFIDYY